MGLYLRPSLSVLLLCSLLFCGAAGTLFETFESGLGTRWVHSSGSDYTGRFEVEDEAIKTPEKSKHYGLTTLLDTPVDPSKGFVVQYEVKFSEGVTCGGSYVKLLTHSDGFDPEDLTSSTPYSIMFGPDKCGTGKIHFILRHKNPLTGKIEEKHLKDPPLPITDEKTHVYTLIIDEDNSYEILVDGEERSSGSLFEDFTPAINPAKEILDPEDKKPLDWVDNPTMEDPTAVKPDDWVDEMEIEDMDATMPKGWKEDEPPLIEDSDASKPEDWDEEEDGEWSPPLIPNPECAVGCGPWIRPKMPNPEYKGPWRAPLIENPDYKGPWVQKTIPNPDYYEDKEPLKSIGDIGALAFELWTIDRGYIFDNIYVGDDEDEAEQIRETYWKPKAEAEKAAEETAKKAQGESEKRLPGQDTAEGLIHLLENLFELPGLKLLQPVTAPVFNFLDQYPLAVFGLFLAPLVLLVLLRVMFSGRGQKLDDVGRAKKNDETGEDDEEDDEGEEEEEEKEDAKEEVVPQAKSEVEEATTSDAQGGSDEIQESDKKGVPRKRKA